VQTYRRRYDDVEASAIMSDKTTNRYRSDIKVGGASQPHESLVVTSGK
jgi:hypothetical protein